MDKPASFSKTRFNGEDHPLGHLARVVVQAVVYVGGAVKKCT